MSSFSEVSFMTSQILAYVVSFSSLTTRSTTETLITGTLKDIPVSFPFNYGSTRPTAFAAPVDEGMMLIEAALPALIYLPHFDGPSTTNWEAVVAWTAVMRPSTIPNLSWKTFATIARQFVVQEAFKIIF